MKAYTMMIITIMSALSFIFLVPQSFIHSESIIRILRNMTQLRIHPAYTGGPELARYYDPEDDDRGAGNLTYPKSNLWRERGEDGVLDLLRYTVHEPVTRSRWYSLPAYWQIDLSFSSLPNPMEGQLGFTFPVIHIYIDIDGTESGHTDSPASGGENIRFSGDHPWDYMVHIDGFSRSGRITSADTAYTGDVPVIIDHHIHTIKIRIPLEEGGPLKILKNPISAHYVLVGAYDQLSEGGFMNITRHGSIHSGGGAESRYEPKVYDYLAPRGTSQETLLASYNPETRQFALLQPVLVDPAAGKDSLPAEELALLEELAKKELAQQEKEEQRTAERGRAPLSDSKPAHMTDLQWLIALFNADRIDEAYHIAEQILEENPEDAVVLSYYGSLVAMKGGETNNVAESIRLVQRSFEIFERAEELLTDEEEMLPLLYNRGNVCMNIPELVFHKSASGAEDFMRAARILSIDKADPKEIAGAYIKAGQLFEEAAMQFRAETAYIKALNIEGISANQQFELAKKGFF